MRVEAISGADVIEKRSSLVQTMRALFKAVVEWGDKLVYTGQKDEALPPKVLEALDAYLAESSSKLLVCMPLKDEREQDTRSKSRSALMMESFEPSQSFDQLAGRMEVIARHAAPALYNAVEHRRMPLRWALEPIAKVKDKLYGKHLAITGLIAAAVVVVLAALIFIPYPFRMEAQGQLLTKERQFVYPMVEGRIVGVKAEHGAYVQAGQPILIMESLELLTQIKQLDAEMSNATLMFQLLGDQIQKKQQRRCSASVSRRSRFKCRTSMRRPRNSAGCSST